MTKGATMWNRNGLKVVQIVTVDADGWTQDVQSFPVTDKAEALAIAKKHGAKFTV